MKSFVVLRFSSMGDVLLTLPAMRGILESNPEVHLIFVTRERFCGYFTGIPRLTVIAFKPEQQHKGFRGILKLYKEIRTHEFTAVVDLHSILRTWILDILLSISGFRVSCIRKHRKVRREIIRHRTPGLIVPHTVDRYMMAFEKAGLSGKVSTNPILASPASAPLIRSQSGLIKIGISPLSRHHTKNWGLSNVTRLISLIQEWQDSEIHLFGGREDQDLLNTLVNSNVFNHAGNLTPSEEISLISTMKVFISMDSANMHLAALAGIPTISIWGATDPKLGFAPLNQPEDFAIYANPAIITCRPCSVYGETPCKRVDSPMICMTSIRPEQVFNKITEILPSTD